MGEKTPDTDASGIERRDILKGLGFGAMGLAGVGAMTGSAAAAGNVVNTGITAPDEDLEDNEILPKTDNMGSSYLPSTGGTEDVPTLDPAETDGTFDLVVKTSGWDPDETALLGKSYTVLSKPRDPMPRHEGDSGRVKGPSLQVTKSVFEEGTVSASTGDVMADTDGVAEIRQNFSVEDLEPREDMPDEGYIIVLTCTDYSPLATATPRPGSSQRFLEGTYPFSVGDNVAVVAHGFKVE